MHKINRSLKKKVVTKQKAELLKKWEKDLFFLQGSSYSPAELNPSTINHPASTSSFTMSGIAKIAVDSESKKNRLNGTLINNTMAPIIPQTDRNRGTSFD